MFLLCAACGRGGDATDEPPSPQRSTDEAETSTEVSEAEPEPAPEEPLTSPIVVLAHSDIGRAEAAARGIAELTGGDLVVLRLGADEPPSADIPAMEQAVSSASAAHVTTVYLGFPLWQGQPSTHATELIERVNLSGKQVIPFFVYERNADLDALGVLWARLGSSGADVAYPISMMMAPTVPLDEISRIATRRVRSRQDLQWNRDLERHRGNADCSAEAEGRPDVALCAVEAGFALVNQPVGGGAVTERRANRLVELPAFLIDLGEVTVEAYQMCARRGECPEVDLRTGICGELVGLDDQLPMPCVTPSAAAAYCEFVGMRLPSLAEWTRAARGDTVVAYPWGPHLQFTGIEGNVGETFETGLEGWSNVNRSARFVSDGFQGLAPPCSFPQSVSMFGVCDLSGNVAEIVTVDGGYAIVGGSWSDWDPTAWSIDGAIFSEADTASPGYGFRCAGPAE